MRGETVWDRGVSPVVSALVLIGIVVVLSAVLLMGTQQLSSVANEPAPMVGADFEFEQEDGEIIATKISGDPVETEYLEIRGPGEAVFEDDELRGGDRFTIDIHEPDDELRLVNTHEDRTQAVLARIDNPIVSDLGGLPSNITMTYEDLEADQSDYDYTDWVVRTGTQIEGYETTSGAKYAQEVEITFDPRASYTIYDHTQYIVPDELGEGEYELTVYDEDGEQIPSESRTGTFDSDDEIEVMTASDAFPAIHDGGVNPGDDELDCDPERTATLTLDLDEATNIDGDAINETTQHGSGMPYDPVSKPSGDHLGWDNSVDRIDAGDPQLLTVQEDWQWPDDSTHIADAYIDVDHDGNGDPEDGDEPIFTDRTWFENPDPDEELNSCEN